MYQQFDIGPSCISICYIIIVFLDIIISNKKSDVYTKCETQFFLYECSLQVCGIPTPSFCYHFPLHKSNIFFFCQYNDI